MLLSVLSAVEPERGDMKGKIDFTGVNLK